MAAEKVTPEAINFMVTHGRGLICLPMTPERLDELEIPLEVTDNSSRARHGVLRVDRRATTARRTGISAPDRAATVLRGDRPDDPAARPGAARPRVSAARARRRRAGARRADRGGRRSGAHRRPDAGRRDLRDHERGRHDGARARADEVRAQARAADDHHRGPDPLPDADRAPGQARRRRRRCRPSTATFTIHAYESLLDGETHVALVRGEIGDGERRAGARALEVPDRRRVPLGALRLRRAARRGDAAHRRRRAAACCCT